MIKKAFLLAGFLACGLAVSAQSYSLRTNIIGLATANLNLEASMTLDRKWSLHLPLQYNPFKFSKNRQSAISMHRLVYVTGCLRVIWEGSSACMALPVHTV